MKKTEENKKYMGMTVEQLRQELADLEKSQFGLRMKASTGETSAGSDAAKLRKAVARVNTALTMLSRSA